MPTMNEPSLYLSCCSKLDTSKEDSVLADRRFRLARSPDITMKLNLLAIAIMCIPSYFTTICIVLAIASLIGATSVCYRAHSYAIAISWSTIAACMVKSSPKKANIGVFKAIY